MSNLEQAYKLLKQYYNLALGSSDQSSLFISIMKYVEVVDKHKGLQDLIYEHVVLVGRKERKQERELETRLTAELDNIFKEITAIKDKNNVKDKTFLYRYNSYLCYIEGAVDSSDGPVYGRRGAMSALTDNMLNSNVPVLLKKAKEYAVYNSHKNFMGWTYLKDFEKLDKIKDKFNSTKHTKIYYNWDKLARVYTTYTDYDRYYKQTYKQNKTFLAMEIFEANKDIKLVLDNKLEENSSSLVNPKELKTHLQYFHTDFEPIVAKCLAGNRPKKKSEKSKFKEHRITYFGNTVKYGKKQLAKTILNSENDLVMQYLIDNPNKRINKKELEEKAVNGSLTKTLDKIVQNLGFKKDLRKMFFGTVASDTIMFTNPVTQKQFELRGFKEPLDI